MKTKTKNRQSRQNRQLSRNYDSKLKSPPTLSFKLSFCVFHFSFLALCLSASLGHAESTAEQLDPIELLVYHSAPASHDVNAPNIPADPNFSLDILERLLPIAKPPLDLLETETADNAALNFATNATSDSQTSKESVLKQQQNPSASAQDDTEKNSKNPDTQRRNQLWQARISTPKDENDNKSKKQLQQIIQQIRSLEFKLEDKTPKPLIVVEPAQKTGPDKTSYTEASEQPQAQKVRPEPLTESYSKPQNTESPPYEPVSSQTLQVFQSLSKQPEQLQNPFELGEILFRSGCLKEAYICYRQALNRHSPDEPDPTQNAAWILLQIGNCLQNEDQQTAIQMYRRLIGECPASPWVDLAEAKIKLIDLYLKDKPRTLITECKPQPL